MNEQKLKALLDDLITESVPFYIRANLYKKRLNEIFTEEVKEVVKTPTATLSETPSVETKETKVAPKSKAKVKKVKTKD